ncbi:MAG: polysaccharide deacetylase family protein [Ignavibacteriales bacterium]|nr:polysaccharide deacetylase family protein [Ignavibacteriales bacterium]
MILLLCVVLLQPQQANAQVLFHGSRHEKKIALTFDACPSYTHGGFDERIVKTLIDSGVPATLFLSGKWIVKHRNIAKKLALVPGFELGNHSYSHPHCTTISDDSIRQELERTETLLKSIAGTSSKLFRPPYCETDQRVDSITQNIGLTTVMYDLASGDPDSTISRERLIQYVATSARNGSIIVMHINGRGWHTAEVLPEIIQALRAKGFIFSKVSELLKTQKSVDSSATTRKNLK